MYSLLQGYVEHNGDTLVSRKHTTPAGNKLESPAGSKLESWVGN